MEPMAIPAALPEHITRTVPVVPTPPRTDEKLNGRTSTKEPTDREEPKMRESGRARDREETIEVRLGLYEDEARIATLLELNGMRRALAFEERFIVAEKVERSWRRCGIARSPSSSCWDYSSRTPGPKSVPWRWPCTRGPG
jgi:hypothetical protein